MFSPQGWKSKVQPQTPALKARRPSRPKIETSLETTGPLYSPSRGGLPRYSSAAKTLMPRLDSVRRTP
ncbi:hypothetical protein C2U72_10270 [Prosthecomicrobium hirschii]|nr:hypothetical protein C2U72_10270 [Prosthecomicrobium hirschii]